MYVTSEGVTQPVPRQSQYLTPWPQRQGHAVESPRRVSRLSNVANRANSSMAMLLLAAVVISTGLAFAVRSKANAMAPSSVKSFGQAIALGNPEVARNDEVVAMASSKKTDGYWIATKRGQVHPFGDVVDAGEVPANHLTNVVDIASTPSGKGYWLMTSEGNIYTYGDAGFYHTAGEKGLVGRTYVKVLPSKSGKGYLLIEQNGDVAAMGDAKIQGTAKAQLNGDKIIDARTTPSGKGYIMLSAKGAVYAFGDATFYGSIAAGQIKDSATAISFSDDGKGYWILTQSGAIYPFGEVQSFGNAAETNPTAAPSIDIAIPANGDGYWIASGKKPEPAPAPRVKVAEKAASQPAVVVNSDNPDIWQALRNCEAGGNYARNSGNGYYGAYQFSAGTWNSMNTGYERADLAPPEVQDDAAQRLQARSGWGQWPACSRKIGAR